MKYKVGDKVRVREDLEVNKSYGRGIFTSRMTPLKGKIVTIDHMDSYNYYIMREDPEGCRWVGEMLLPINDITKYKIGDEVLVREDLIAEQMYGENICTSEMASFKGKIVTIKRIYESKYTIKEDCEGWWWTDEMFSGKISQDFIPEKPVSQNTIPEGENSSDIITVKTTKLKLLLL